MPGRIITLKRPAVCHDCGARLAVGTPARWYRSGAVFGLTCHGRGEHTPRVEYRGEDYQCSDAGYEDRCAAACGEGL